MMKLMCNTLADQCMLMDAEGNVINWGYAVSLDNLQRTEGLRLRSKSGKCTWNDRSLSGNQSQESAHGMTEGVCLGTKVRKAHME